MQLPNMDYEGLNLFWMQIAILHSQEIVKICEGNLNGFFTEENRPKLFSETTVCPLKG